MSLTNDIPTKLRVPAQLALDAKSVVTTLSQLQTLGTNDNLAYTYYKGMVVLCSEDLGLYRWRPVNEGETGGTLPSNFTYPAGIVSEDGVVYSNIAYNFFKETTLTVENLTELVQIRNVGTGAGVYKDTTIVGDTTQFNFRSVVTENLGTGESFLRDIQQNTDELNVRVKTITSTKSSINIEGGLNELNFEVNNLQKTISIFPYEFTSDDDKYTIFVDNASSNVLLNIPDDLVDNFCCTLIQKGTGEVAVVTTGTSSLSYPSTLQNIIKGQNFWALIEKESNLDNYFLIGSLKTI